MGLIGIPTLAGPAALEAQLLGALIWKPSMLPAVDIATDDFSDEKNADIYAAMLELAEEGVEINEATIYSKTRKDGAYLCSLPTNYAVSGENVLYHLQELKANIAERKKRLATEDMARKVRVGADATQASAQLEAEIRAIDERYIDDRADERAALLGAIDAAISTVRDRKKADILPTGIIWLDDANAGGLVGGDYVCLAARPSCGKTALALSVLSSLSMADSRSMLLSFEMSPQSLAERILTAITHQGATRLLRNADKISDHARDLFLSLQYEARQCARNIWVVNKGVVGPAGLSRRILQAKADGCRLIVCDHIHLVPHPSCRGTTNDKISDLSRAWKTGLVEANLPGIMIAQLNRSGEKEARAPKLSDLRDSGALEQDADVVWFLHRKDGVKTGLVPTTFTQAKGRNVGLAASDLLFDGEKQTFFKQEDRQE